MNLHFIRPEWFLALAPLALLLWFLARKHSTSSDWQSYIAPHLAGALISGKAEHKSRRGLWVLGASLMIAITALAGPAINKVPLPVFASGAARVLVMDMSVSMYATDLVPNRVTQAKFRATDLINQTSEGDTGLIAYAGDAFVISPLTRDKNTLLNLLPSLSPDIMPALGSAPAEGVKEAIELLTHGGHLSGDIVLMTDGLDEVDEADIRRAMKDSRFRLAIYGFGTAQGAPMKLPDGSFVRGADNALVMPTLNAQRLNDFAASLNGIYIGAKLDGSDLQQLSQWLATEGDATRTELLGDSWQDLGPYLALLLILPLLLAFRHGLTLAALLCLLPLLPPPATAAIWQTADQQAMEKFRSGDYKSAAEGFERSDWKAAADYRAGDFESALKGFEADSSAEGFYNQGNALMQLGQFDEAAKRYQQALEQNPDFENAKTNQALAKALAEQSKQNKSSQQGDSSQNEESQGEQSQDENSQSEQSQGKQQNSGESQSSGGNQSSEGNQGSGDQQGSGGQGEQQSQSADSQQSANSQQSENSDQNGSGDKQGGNDAPMSADTSTNNDSATGATKSNGEEAKPQQSAASASAAAADKPQDGDADKQQGAARGSPDDSADKETGANVPVPEPSTNEGNALPPEMERALKSVDDDPSVLLRNKMQLEYQLRRERGEHRQEKQKW
ncbi:VWA domain-containing protein [Shewanella sp. JM162201]|uniref:VWA domain-containing protein n=1 Tax=Shewanella jiangmenensis TaxID=2837387 RepID=A0ABS5V7A3_9GAMM|nr:VWA domain-containing protein [Shewanella jiangmenensis]MBT1446317.1 VWA domain-containing protein [Shewanella jiangmenensis]